MTTRFDDELAVVTGASGGFGKVIVASLAARGLTVIAIGRRLEELEMVAHDIANVRPCAADIGLDSSIATIAAALDGPVRAIVHAPGLPFAGGVLDAAPGALAEAVNIKAGGFLRLARAADARLAGGARLIGIGGHYGLEPTAYATSASVGNAALIALSRQLSLAYGPRRVTSHVIAPGPADTERLRKVAAPRAEKAGRTVDDVLADMQAESSLGAFTTPEQVAWAVTMLLDPEADAMTGSTLMLDSGRRRGLP
ncbi:SDR family oxidoreductase [Rhodoblastus acidophilus]|uniref:SDR family oxidoreductase n=1 Tax=Candidatus Rhodoblastus alkanivorans TaxID=2954117 RepID=A0ABS9Z4R7_9HYPH|nr:SDR family oxidoreductase [Candidatus Rhodoblastus alkanivorans]MCI4679982.1 SDR family oxidoreductase [Candidatus Rhodoblastus alkanivorans]MCI4682365.1 SDR family oxidoreductase [Candidatus Rhodoblastus alkanivorans]MDI4639668.1 SDR family oxidoreductase [Rhodoblastus acidophilus]